MDPIAYDDNDTNINNDKKIADVDVDEYIRKINKKRLEKRRSILDAAKKDKEKTIKDIKVFDDDNTTNNNFKQQNDNRILKNDNSSNIVSTNEKTIVVNDKSIHNITSTTKGTSPSIETSIEEKFEYLNLKKKLAEKDKILAQVKDEQRALESESRRLQLTVDAETNKKCLKEKQEAEKLMLMKSIEMDNDSDDIQKSLTDHISSLKRDYNESLEEFNMTTKKLTKSQENIEELNSKYHLMKKTLMKTMDQYESLKESFDDDGVENNNEKNTLFCTLESLIPPIPFIYNKSV